MNLSLSILASDGSVKSGVVNPEEALKNMTVSDADFVYLAAKDMTFEDGDHIVVETETAGNYLMVKLAETLNESLIYVPGTRWVYRPMLTENGLKGVSEATFTTKRHYMQVRVARQDEIAAYRNLALNPHAQKDENGAFPHAYANVETRNDATFFGRNAIDGVFANNFHGSYPYQSWGINRQADAALTIDFGRLVEIDRIGVTLRADFPHDSFWTNVSLEFDGGQVLTLDTVKTGRPQYFEIEPIQTTTVVFKDLIKSEEDDSPFPALTQLECFGINVL